VKSRPWRRNVWAVTGWPDLPYEAWRETLDTLHAHSQVLGKLVEDFRSRVRDTRMRPRISTLTPREREILKLLAEGNSVKEIAVSLGLSVKTVEAHKFNLMRKLDIHNKAQLVTYAIQKKIIKIPVNQ